MGADLDRTSACARTMLGIFEPECRVPGLRQSAAALLRQIAWAGLSGRVTAEALPRCFGGVRRAGSEHLTVQEPAYPLGEQRGWRGVASPPLRPPPQRPRFGGVADRAERCDHAALLCRSVGLVARLGSEHGAGDREQAVRDRTERAGTAVAPAPTAALFVLRAPCRLPRRVEGQKRPPFVPTLAGGPSFLLLVAVAWEVMLALGSLVGWGVLNVWVMFGGRPRLTTEPLHQCRPAPAPGTQSVASPTRPPRIAGSRQIEPGISP